MSTNVHSPDKDSGTDGIESMAEGLAKDLARSFTVGTDADGYDHHYFRPADAVVVYDENGVEHYQYLEGTLLEKWVDHVDDVHDGSGWRSLGPHAANGIARDRQRKEGM